MGEKKNGGKSSGAAATPGAAVAMRSIESILPCATNAKTHDQKQIENVAASIRQFGFLQPIVVSAEGEIVIGHCRYEAAKRLGLAEVPCITADHLDGRQIRALRVLDNKLNESPWDPDLLKVEVEDLDLGAMGFDVDFDIPKLEGGKDGAQEIDASELSEMVTFKVELSLDDYGAVAARLREIDEDPAIALVKLCKPEAQE